MCFKRHHQENEKTIHRIGEKHQQVLHDKGLVSIIYKELLQSTNKKNITQF